MEQVRDIRNKVVCMIDRETKSVEIVKGDAKTVIRFHENGEFTVEKTKLKRGRDL